MKKQWVEPQLAQISVIMTAEPMKSGGSGDSLLPEQLNPWKDCECCS